MEPYAFAEILRMLALIHRELERMATAAEAQVAETKAMREMVKTAILKAREEED